MCRAKLSSAYSSWFQFFWKSVVGRGVALRLGASETSADPTLPPVYGIPILSCLLRRSSFAWVSPHHTCVRLPAGELTNEGQEVIICRHRPVGQVRCRLNTSWVCLVCLSVCLYVSLFGWMGECMDGWMDGWMDGLMDGWMDGWIQVVRRKK